MILLANKLDQDRKNSTDASFPEVLGLLVSSNSCLAFDFPNIYLRM